MVQATNIDHVTLCVKNLEAAEYLFTKILGFDVIWSARDVGSDKSSMDTVVVQRGAAKIALMQGRNKEVKSQICEFIDRYGEGSNILPSKWTTLTPYPESGRPME